MLKTNLFLLSGRNKAWVAGIIYAILTIALICVPGEVKAVEKTKTTSVVYAQSKPRVATVITNTPKETFNEGELLIEESVMAMQFEIANEIALKEKTKREKKEAKEKAAKEKAEKEANMIQLSKEDKEVLLRIVEAEATGEDIKGKILVANVVLNRVNNKKFPNSVKKVVFANRQFSPVKDGRYYKVSISADTKKAVKRALEGEDYSKGALYFMSRKQASAKNVRWFDTKLTMVIKHGTHEFFK